MKIVMKAKFNASKNKIERFDFGKYLVYFASDKPADIVDKMKKIISESMGTPIKKIIFSKSDADENYFFEIRY